MKLFCAASKKQNAERGPVFFGPERSPGMVWNALECSGNALGHSGDIPERCGSASLQLK